MDKLSVVIITLNEEENIGRCIDSVSNIADEVIVVDSLSTDKTIEIAEAMGARIITRTFTNYIDQKNFAAAQSANEYVLNLDADECLDDVLRKAIAKEKEAGFSSDAYSMNRLNFYEGKPIKTSGWYPDTKIRLWNKGKGKWEGKLIHEKMVLSSGATLKHLNGDMLHYTFPTYELLVQQKEKFATISAQQLMEENAVLLILKMVFSPPFKFIKSYFFQLGFTDGSAGLTICYHQSREVFLKYKRAIQLK